MPQVDVQFGQGSVGKMFEVIRLKRELEAPSGIGGIFGLLKTSLRQAFS